MKKLTLGFVFQIILVALIFSQPVKSWQQIAKADDTFYELVERADLYFDQQEVKDDEYKHYMRWKGEMGYHVNPNGTLPNVNAHRIQAIKMVGKKHSTENENRAYHGNWSLVGPTNYTGGDSWSGGGIGRINCMAFHPTNTNIFYIGAANGGLWKTTNYGSTWTPLTDHLPTIGISGIVINQSNPNIIYILTGDGDGSPVEPNNLRIDASTGVLKSLDAGNTWSQTGLNFLSSDLKYGFDLVSHPTNQSVILAAMGADGIYRTFNGGNTWSKVDSNRTVWDLEYSEAIPDLVFVASNQGLLRSVNGGVSFTLTIQSTFPSTYARMSIALSPSEPSTVYAVFGGNTGITGTFRGLFKSEDFGADQTFTMKSNSPNILGNALDGNNNGDFAWFTLAITVDPLDDDQIFVAGVNMWKSQNGGSTWGRETWSTKNYEPIDPYVHADWHKMYFQGNTLFANTDGGIAISNDYGNDWSELTQGLAITQIYEINMRNDSYLISAQDNGVMTGSNGNMNGHQVLGGDGFACAWHPNNGQDLMFISTQTSLARRAAGSNIFIWEEPTNVGNGFWFTDLKFDTDNLNYIYFDKGNELFRANENTAIWDYNFDSLKTNSILSSNIMGFSQGHWPYVSIMYVADRTKIIKTTNLGVSPPDWTPLTNPAQDSANISDILMAPDNGSDIWLTCSGYNQNHKVFFSGNGGASWNNISAGLPNVPTRCITFDPGSNKGAYLGTDIGIFYKNADMPEWVFFSQDLPKTVVTDIEVSNGSVYAGTYGRGLWKASPFSNCPNLVVLNPGNDSSNPLSSGIQHHSAGINILSNRNIAGGMETEVYYSAGDRTDLILGFEAKAGAFFEVKTGPCPN